MLYENSTPAPARLPGSTTATKNFLTQTGTGSGAPNPRGAPSRRGPARGDRHRAGRRRRGGTTFGPVLLDVSSFSTAQTANLLGLHTITVPGRSR